MEEREVNPFQRLLLSVLILGAIAGTAFVVGLAWSTRSASAADQSPSQAQASPPKAPRIVYPDKTELDFEGAQIEGELRNPGEFYFQHRKEEKFDSLVKRRKNFHREMLRDVVLSK